MSRKTLGASIAPMRRKPSINLRPRVVSGHLWSTVKTVRAAGPCVSNSLDIFAHGTPGSAQACARPGTAIGATQGPNAPASKTGLVVQADAGAKTARQTRGKLHARLLA